MRALVGRGRCGLGAESVASHRLSWDGGGEVFQEKGSPSHSHAGNGLQEGGGAEKDAGRGTLHKSDLEVRELFVKA